MSKLDKDQINPTKENIAKILNNNYPINDFDFSVNLKGAHNTSLIIKKKNNKYAMRVYCQNRRTKDEIRLEVEYINFLLKNGIPVPELIQTNKKSFITETKIDGKIWFSILMKFIEGKHPTEFYSKKLLKELAYAQARMHLLAPIFKSKFSNLAPLCDTGKKSKDFLFIDLLHINKINLKKIKRRKLVKFLLNSKKLSIKFRELPVAIIHKDIHAFNILKNKGKLVAILDFDDLFNGPIITALSYMLWDIYVKNNDWNYVGFYIKEYEKIRKILPEEKRIMKDFLSLRNYVMGAVEYLVGGENSKGVLMMDMSRYFEIENDIDKLKLEKFYGTV